MRAASGGRSVWRLLGLLLLAVLALQLYFALRIALMLVVDPWSTTFERSELWRLSQAPHTLAWHQQWVGRARLSPRLQRAVIAAEDAGFSSHHGIEWEALQNAWERNRKAAARNNRLLRQAEQGRAFKADSAMVASAGKTLHAEPKVVGGSTITQQLAKNLFLEGERRWPRKAQEMVIAFMLEGLLGKQRILEIYLNHVEWGEGVFGAEAAAWHYFHLHADQLSTANAARLAVLLPAPKRFEKRLNSAYLQARAAAVAARMEAVAWP